MISRNNIRGMTILSIKLFAFLIISNHLFAQSNLKHHFKFDNSAIDSIGGIIGTVSGAALTSDEFGASNAAYEFNGISDFISITDPRLNYPLYTYSICIMPKSLPASGSNKAFYGIGNFIADQYFYIANNQIIAGTPVHHGFECSSYMSPFVYPPDYVSNGILPSIDTWYHLVYTRDTVFLKLYINGLLVDSTRVRSPVVNYGEPSPSQAFVGSRDGFSSFFKGKIEDIKIFDRALSAREILSLSCKDSVIIEDSTIDESTKDCIIHIPDAFTPNGDNINDVFTTFVNCPVEYFNIKIFNRWGEITFESNSIDQYWDGTFKNTEALVGVYMWLVQVKFENDEAPQVKKGNVTLLR